MRARGSLSENIGELADHLPPVLFTRRTGHVSTQGKGGLHNLREELTSETDQAGILISDFQPPQL